MRKINFDYIPSHINCINCGDCCGPVPIDTEEYINIKNYCIENKVEPNLSTDYTCPFRDNKNKKCMIYDVRPTICKLFGVTTGMDCKNGNTCNIDGYKHILGGELKDVNGMNNLVRELKQAF